MLRAGLGETEGQPVCREVPIFQGGRELQVLRRHTLLPPPSVPPEPRVELCGVEVR